MKNVLKIKAHNKRDNLQQQLDANEQKIEEGKRLQEEHGNELPISAGFFFINPFEVVYYAGGTSNAFRHLPEVMQCNGK